MEEKKVANSERIRLRRTMELREFALAAFYPLTHSGDAAQLKRAEDALPQLVSAESRTNVDRRGR